MPKIKYKVCLSKEEREQLLSLVKKGTSPARAIMRANILLAADENNPDGKKSRDRIAEMFNAHMQTVQTVRKTYSKQGLDATIGRKKREMPPVEPKITGEVEAKIIALSYGAPPTGRAKWSLRLLAEKAVELEYIDSISHEAVGRLIMTTRSAGGLL